MAGPSERLRALDVTWLAAHVLLALLMDRVPELGRWHAAAALGAGLYFALLRFDAGRALAAAAYVAAAEVLWRMCGAPTFWEVSKYGLIVIFAALLARRAVHSQARLGLPLVFLACLSPAVIATLDDLGLTEEARGAIAFNLAGPVACAFGLAACSAVVLRGADQRRVLMALLAPTVGVLSVAAYGVMTSSIRFHTESNFAASGGFGPNQVSATLGVGLLVCGLLAYRSRGAVERAALVALGLGFVAQSLLTFSRGGLFNVVMATASGALVVTRDTRARIAGGALVLTFGLALVVLVPRLDDYTGGALVERYSDTDTTGRAEIAWSDLALFVSHPLVGVGVGRSPDVRDDVRFLGVAPHTEFTRLLAEHGLLGVLALLVLLAAPAATLRRARSPGAQLWVVLFAAWAFSEMLHAAWRLALNSLLLALTVAPPPGGPEKDGPQADSDVCGRV